jgi:hypothetical protein
VPGASIASTSAKIDDELPTDQLDMRGVMLRARNSISTQLGVGGIGLMGAM